jgi:prepilin-type processing-associated H-X9-DG protein
MKRRLSRPAFTLFPLLAIFAVLLVLLGALMMMLPRLQAASENTRSQNNLKQIGLAMHNYHDANNHFPADVVNKAGKPLLSWRVLILPYIEQSELYKEFRLDEAWDSDHNKKLLAKMPKIFADPTGKTEDKTVTFYQGIKGPDAFFEDGKKITIVDITDGTSNTIMAAEAEKAVPWTKPVDLVYNQKGKLPAFGGFRPGYFNALFADGSVRGISRKAKEAALRATITRNGGEVINYADLNP